jgi:hypothetical protein
VAEAEVSPKILVIALDAPTLMVDADEFADGELLGKRPPNAP